MMIPGAIAFAPVGISPHISMAMPIVSFIFTMLSFKMFYFSTPKAGVVFLFSAARLRSKEVLSGVASVHSLLTYAMALQFVSVSTSL